MERRSQAVARRQKLVGIGDVMRGAVEIDEAPLVQLFDQADEAIDLLPLVLDDVFQVGHFTNEGSKLFDLVDQVVDASLLELGRRLRHAPARGQEVVGAAGDGAMVLAIDRLHRSFIH